MLTPTTAYGIGDLAYLVGTASFKMGGASETMKYAEVLRKGADGKWQYVVDMFSGVAVAQGARPCSRNQLTVNCRYACEPSPFGGAAKPWSP